MTRRTHAGSHPHCKAIANAYSVSCPVSLLTASFVILLTDAHSSRNLQKIERATFLRPGVDATGAVITDTRQLDRMCARSCYQRAHMRSSWRVSVITAPVASTPGRRKVARSIFWRFRELCASVSSITNEAVGRLTGHDTEYAFAIALQCGWEPAWVRRVIRRAERDYGTVFISYT